MATAGPHENVRFYDTKDVNSRFMLLCEICSTCAHAFTMEEAASDLSNTKCAPSCTNCNALRHASMENPPAPIGCTPHTTLHVCPNDGNRWWQSNTHLHLWQQVTSDGEWRVLSEEQAHPERTSSDYC